MSFPDAVKSIIQGYEDVNAEQTYSHESFCLHTVNCVENLIFHLPTSRRRMSLPAVIGLPLWVSGAH